MIRRQPARRRGIAAVEFAMVFMLFMLPLLLGIWEIGRLVQVQQIVSNGAREGARLAAQGYTLKSDGTTTQIYANNPSPSGSPNVQAAVYNYLVAAGLTSLQMADVTVTFDFITATGFNEALTDPYMGVKNQPFTVTVSVPWQRVRWVNLGFLNPNQNVTFTVTWRMLIDDPFTVNQTLPTF